MTEKKRRHFQRIALIYTGLLLIALVVSIVKSDDRAFWYSATALSGVGNLLPLILE